MSDTVQEKQKNGTFLSLDCRAVGRLGAPFQERMSRLNPLDFNEVKESIESAALWIENDLNEGRYDQGVVRALPAMNKNAAVFLVQFNAHTASQIKSLSHVIQPIGGV